MNESFRQHQVNVTESDVLTLIRQYADPPITLPTTVVVDMGTALLPSLHFADGDPNYGVYSATTQSVDTVCVGVSRLSVSDTVTATGITWTVPQDLSGVNFMSITWSETLEQFLIVGSELYISADGRTWTHVANPDTNTWWSSVVWSPELALYVAVATPGTDGLQAMTSPNGTDWTIQTTPGNSYWNTVVWSSSLGIFCAFAYQGPDRVMTSPDGVNWTVQDAPTNSYWTGLWVAEQSRFIALPTNDGFNPYFQFGIESVDGIHWSTFSTTSLPSNSPFYNLSWSPTRELFVVGRVADSIMTSPNASTWTDTGVLVNGTMAACWAPGMDAFVVVGYGGQVTYSHDGTTWPQYLGSGIPTSDFNAMTYSPTLKTLVATTLQPNGIVIGILESTTATLAVTGDAVVAGGDILPLVDAVYDLGTGSYRWNTVYAQTGTINTSDRAQKKDIAPSELGLDFVTRLEPVRYKLRVDANEHAPTHYGLIAQDVQHVLAGVGISSEMFAGYVEFMRDGETAYGLRYQEFIGPLIRAVQELAQRIVELEKRRTRI